MSNELKREQSSKFHDRILSCQSSRNESNRCLREISRELKSTPIMGKQTKIQTSSTMKIISVTKRGRAISNPIKLCIWLAVILTTPTALHNVSS